MALAEECLEAVEEPSEGAVRWERRALPVGQPGRRRGATGLPAIGGGAARRHTREGAGGVLSGYGWYLAMASRTDDARGWSERALAAADTSGDPLERCRALLTWGSARAEEARGLAALWAAREARRRL